MNEVIHSYESQTSLGRNRQMMVFNEMQFSDKQSAIFVIYFRGQRRSLTTGRLCVDQKYKLN